MARSRANTVSPRRIAAGVFVFIGLFVMFYGLGNRSHALFVTGAAIMVLSFSVRLFTTLRRPARQWLLGTGLVLEASEPPPDARFGRCALQLAVDAPGIAGETVLHNDPRVPVAQWPYPGLELPIEIAADDPSIIRVRWRQVPRRESYDELDSEYGQGQDMREPPGAPPTAPAPREALIDFDIDNPPGGSTTGDPGSRPVVAPLPPELGDLVDADELAQASGPPADVPQPRRRPRPRPHRPVPSPAEDRTPGDEPEGTDQPEARDSAEPEPAPRREPAMAAAAGGPATSGPATSGPATDTRMSGGAGSLVDDLVTTYPSAHPGPAGAINNVGITVLVSELDRSIDFYRDQLGFYEVDGGDGNTVLASGETRLVLRSAPDLGKIKHRSVYLNLEVSDIDAVYTELKTNGVRFTNPPRPVNRTARLELWAATFRDPDGHGIALTQWRPAPRGAGQR